MPGDSIDSNVGSALGPRWGNNRTEWCEVFVPASTEMYRGWSAAQPMRSGQVLAGGFDQVVVSRAFAADGSHYGPGRPLCHVKRFGEWSRRFG